MKEYKNIDELFKEAESGFEIQPSAEVWSGIEQGIAVAGSTSNIAYKKWVAAAALLLLLGISSLWYFSSHEGDAGIEPTKEIQDVTLIETIPTPDLTNGNSAESVGVATEESGEFSEEVITEDTEVFAGTETPLTEDYEKNDLSPVDDELLENFNLDVTELKSHSIYEIAALDAEPIDKPITVEEYIKQRKKLHTYTGLGIKPAMVYYPNTTDQFTFTAGADFGIVFNKFYVETGIAYQEMKERGVYKFNYRSNDSIGFYNKVVSFEIDPADPNNITFKTSKTTVYDSIDHYNVQSPLFKYSYLNVPMKVGYRLWERKKLTLGIETGVIFSKLLSSEIPEPKFTLSGENTLISIEDNTPARVDLNLQMVVSIRFNYKFTKAISLSAQPEFTKYLNSIYDTKNGDPNIKPYTMGIRFGIYYDF